MVFRNRERFYFIISWGLRNYPYEGLRLSKEARPIKTIISGDQLGRRNEPSYWEQSARKDAGDAGHKFLSENPCWLGK